MAFLSFLFNHAKSSPVLLEPLLNLTQQYQLPTRCLLGVLCSTLGLIITFKRYSFMVLSQVLYTAEAETTTLMSTRFL
jgi:hypothetical protein